MEIKDSGDRTLFESGAVRDMHEGKGRCDLLPMDVVKDMFVFVIGESEYADVFYYLNAFQNSGNKDYLFVALSVFAGCHWNKCETMLLEVSKHFEDGAKKYGDNNWRKGIPVNVYIDSAVRHFLKFLRGDTDEPHDRAFCWNLLCAAWTCKNLPELNPYRNEETE